MTESPEQKNQANFSESQSSQPILKRRQFIGAGAAAAAALILPKSAQADPEIAKGAVKIAQATTKVTSARLTPPSDTTFPQPKIISSAVNGNNSYGTLDSELEIAKKLYGDQNTYIRVFKEVDRETRDFNFEPGPTLCVNPGDKISLNVTNNLPKNSPPPPAGSTNVESTYCDVDTSSETPLAIPALDSAEGNPAKNKPGCFNTTNLHFHGLHVSPLSINKDGKPISSGTLGLDMNDIQESSDDVLYSLTPEGGNNKYCPWLPAFHAPGTHWYHAHHHGSTALQAAEGLAGALIVKEPPGQEICQGAPDVVMIMQEEPEAITESDYKKQGVLDPAFNKITAQEKLDRGVYERTGGNKGTFLINGEYQPTLNLKNGEIQRWRLINANSTPRAFSLLQVQDSEGNPVVVYRIAVDGITLYGKDMDDPSVKVTKASFAPGNRVDFLVNLAPGDYTLHKLVDPSVGGTKALTNSAQMLATITVSDQAFEPDLDPEAPSLAGNFAKLIASGIPTTGMPDYLQQIKAEDIDNYNQTPVVFQAAGNTPQDRVTTTGRGDFTITNSKFNPTKLANMSAKLNSREEWIVANAKGGAAHPFHIHVNPFLVVAIANITNSGITNTDTPESMYNKLQKAEWKDTSVDANGIDPTIWWDTFTIPPNTAYKIRHRFDDYWGNFVLHCHVLLHEDQGMMWTVQIDDVEVEGKYQGANPCEPLLEPVNGGKPLTT